MQVGATECDEAKFTFRVRCIQPGSATSPYVKALYLCHLQNTPASQIHEYAGARFGFPSRSSQEEREPAPSIQGETAHNYLKCSVPRAALLPSADRPRP